MGIYTELVLACDLPLDTPANVINAIKWLIDDPGANPNLLSPRLRLDRGILAGGSAEIPGKVSSSLERDPYRNTYELTIRTSNKDQGDDFGKFLVWISRYVLTDGYVGYMHVETIRDPILIYFQKGRLLLKRVVGTQDEPIPEDISQYP